MSEAISVIVPIHNSATTLGRCLTAIRSQLRTADELIVVDDHSVDGSLAIAIDHGARIESLISEHGRIAARARGADCATHSVLLCIDSDIVVPEEFIETVRRSFSEFPALAGLYCRLAAPGESRTCGGRYKNIYMHTVFESLAHNAPVLYGSAHAVRRQHFARVNRRFTGVEDNALGLLFKQRGLPIEYLNSVEVLHLKEYSLPQLLKNDFSVARKWVPLLLLHSRQSPHPLLHSLRSGFLHAPPTLLLAVVCSPLALLCLLFQPMLAPLFIVGWLLCNAKFIRSFWRFDRGFLVVHCLLLLLSQLSYGAGVARGLLDFWRAPRTSRRKRFQLEESSGEY